MDYCEYFRIFDEIVAIAYSKALHLKLTQALRIMKFLLKILSGLYYMAISFRHWLFDCGLLKSHKFKTPIICVGNITVGGTGKTPTAEMIINYMQREYNIALLSRGYGRRTTGYMEVTNKSSYRDVGDEPLQIKLKFPNILVVVCEKRVDAIKRIEEEHPEINLIIMDDGFQHRHVNARINVVVVDATRPFEKDHYLPAGTLRDSLDSIYRGHYFIVTKCPKSMSHLDQRLWRKDLQKIAYQKIYFTRIANTEPVPLFSEGTSIKPGDDVVVMSGIGNPKSFVRSMRRRYNVVKSFNFPDHHIYTVQDMQQVAEELQKHPNAMLLTTEKDAVKLRRSRRIPEIVRQRMFYVPMKMEFIEGSDPDFLGTLNQDIKGKIHLDNETDNTQFEK